MVDGDMDKRAIWARVLESRQQKGLPYIFFSDNINRNKPQVYKDKNLQIYSSNLCSEIALPSSYDESFICCLRSEEHTSELQSLMLISYAVFCLKKKKNTKY